MSSAFPPSPTTNSNLLTSSGDPFATPIHSPPSAQANQSYFPLPNSAGSTAVPPAALSRSGSSLHDITARSSQTDLRPVTAGARKRKFVSQKLKGPIQKPWLEKRDKGRTWAYWIIVVWCIAGVAISAVLVYFAIKNVQLVNQTCLVLDEKWNDLNNWKREVQLDGFGNNEFEVTTNEDKNSYVRGGKLYITPTLMSDDENVFTGSIDLGDACTASNRTTGCTLTANSTGRVPLPPVKSARLTSLQSIRYGRVEVVAKMPTGDWLWPAIWMMPKDSVYGSWPRSGELDIAESRGNLPTGAYPYPGVDTVASALHFGPWQSLDRFWKATGERKEKRNYFNAQEHTFAVEWNEKFLRTYVDNRLQQTLYFDFSSKSMYDYGEFPLTYQNGSGLVAVPNLWEGKPNTAPFDQEFYMILNVAVGGTNGWFPDDAVKPWINDDEHAVDSFAKSQDVWSATWPSDLDQRSLVVSSVKMWKEGSC